MGGPTYRMEASFSGIVAGIDEAGRGPWAGPVVAAAVILDPRKLPAGIDDSKKLTPAKREALYSVIMEQARCGVGIASVVEIDMFNILEATKIAMCRAVEALPVAPHFALVDGNSPPKLACNVTTVVDGDAQCLSIAAASIIAKVTRDRIMSELSRVYPGYGWQTNAGYGTAEHQEAMVNFGVTPYHRRSFAPVRTLLELTDLFGIVA